MNSNLANKLIDQYPDLFILKPDKKISSFTMTTIPEVGDGWYDLLESLCWLITEYQQKTRPEFPVRFSQIKEKFAHLRVYVDSYGDGYVEDLINMHEYVSQYICEDCGQVAAVDKIKTGWQRTLCKACSLRHFTRYNKPLP
jgi:hypothetical protein